MMNDFSHLPIEYEWSFSDKTRRDTSYITHGYYTYPAKFIPQLATKIIQEYSQENDTVIDPFMGSGTTIVEAIINHRIGIGCDINEIATLTAKVKTTPIKHQLLIEQYDDFILYQSQLNNDFEATLKQAKEYIKLPKRIDFWFKPHIKDQLLLILYKIINLNNKDIRDFFLVAFAQSLKSCSIWLQKSVKPTRDLHKKEVNPLNKLDWQLKRMIKKHEEFNHLFSQQHIDKINSIRIIQNSDSRTIPCQDQHCNLIVTSPPYVTSYEYADLHQLPLLWLGYLDELSIYRKKFIGSAYRKRNKIDLKSIIADNIIKKLRAKKQEEVANYFADMLESFIEMKRVLKTGGKATIVIGNTKLQNIEILNAEVFKEQFENIGFKTHKIIKREIPSKMLPSTRDPKTGRFTKIVNKNKTLAYPIEYILVMEKI